MQTYFSAIRVKILVQAFHWDGPLTCTCWPHHPWCHQGTFSGQYVRVGDRLSDTQSIFHSFEAGIANAISSFK